MAVFRKPLREGQQKLEPHQRAVQRISRGIECGETVVVAVFEDAGISGAKGRDQRPGFAAMMKAVARREFDLVAAWSVDRLGRSLTDLLEFLKDLHAKRVDLF